MRRIEHIQKQEISERLFAERRRPRGCSSSSKAAKQQSSSSGERKRGGGGANKRGKNIEGQLRKPKRDRWSSRPRSRSFWVALAYSMLQRVYSVEKARLVQSGRAETKRQSLERAFYLRSESFVSGGMASPPPPQQQLGWRDHRFCSLFRSRPSSLSSHLSLSTRYIHVP